MADLGITLAGKLIEVTGSAIIKEICDMWGYKSQLEELNRTVCTIKNVLLDADSKRELSHEACGYIAELKAAVYDADDLFDEFITLAELKLLDGNKDDKFLKKVRRFFSSKKKGVSQARRMSRKVKDIKDLLDTIASNHHKFGLSVDYKPICRRREETCSYVDAGDIIGREDDKKAVIDMLLGPDDVHENIRFVTIVGVGGLGKTTLAQLVYNDKEIETEFPDPKLRLWVCVSDQDGVQFDVKVILCKILELVSGSRLDGTSAMECVQKQFQEQLRGKKYLLVLDDIWNEHCEKWRSLRKFLTLGQEGSRIVVTTRSEMTAKIIGEKHVHKLQGLSPKNSWLFFESVAFNKEEHEQVIHLELVEIGKKIVEKCCNTPLAIKVLGSLLFGQPLSKWQTFVDSGLAEIRQGDNEIISILKLSYRNLIPSLKNCFSYCALFPKNSNMSREDLISLWMAQGYIVPLDIGQSIEDAAEEHFLILLRRCFFQDVTGKFSATMHVKIHDLMHDVAQEVGREEIGVVSFNTTKLGDKIRHVYYADGNYPQSFFFKSKIRSFIVRYNHSRLADAQIVSLICLRVLDLKSAGIRRLSDSIGMLLHLRYLDLSLNYDLQALSDSITSLHNLQTLILHSCHKLTELPKDFCKLVKLRLLDLSYCYDLTSMPSYMCKLSSLGYLNLSGCFNLSGMPSGMGKLTKLRVLPFFLVGKERRVSTEEQYVGELKDLKALTNLKGRIRIYILKNYTSDGEGGYLKSMKHLSEVDITFLDNEYLECEDVMKKLEPPSNIKEIILTEYMGTTIPSWGRAEDNWAISFQHLVKLHLISCYNLEQIPSLSELRFLKSLSICSLHKLEHIVVEDKSSNEGENLTTYFPSLESLRISHLNSFTGWWREKELVKNDGYDDMSRSSFTFPCLSNLTILNCPKVMSFPFCRSLDLNEVDCSGNSQGGVRLRKVKIDDVGLFKAIHSQCLTSLHIISDFKVESLSEFGDVFRKYSSSLRSLKITNCQNLMRLGRGGLEHLTALEELKLNGNIQLSLSDNEVDDDGMPWISLHHCLRSLSIKFSNAIESLPESLRNLTSLQNLEIVGCPQLKERCEEPNGEDWPKIRHIPHIQIVPYSWCLK